LFKPTFTNNNNIQIGVIMKLFTSARLIGTTLLTVGLITGCATDGGVDTAAAATKAIAGAKTANAEAKAANYEWRDTGKFIAEAEKKLKTGDTDGALSLANKAMKQANIAVSQAASENKKFLK
jgi:hypothetical protein